MKLLPVFATLLLSLFAVPGLAQAPAAEEEVPEPTEASVPIEEWDGTVDEYGFIPELGHYAGYKGGFINFRV